MNKITQKEMVFFKLHQEFYKNPNRYVPTWEFGGEMYMPKLKTWVLMSYKCPTRLTDIYQENPGLLERELVKGKSGAEYYAYRIAKGALGVSIRDIKLVDFYKKIERI